MIVNLLERFGGYTFSTLMEEDVELVRMCAIVAEGAQREVEADG